MENVVVEEGIEQAVAASQAPAAELATAGMSSGEDGAEGNYTVFVVNCKWSKNERRRLAKNERNAPLPDTVMFDIPQNVLNQANKPKNVFENVIETFVYDTLSKKHGYELHHCQIYLPLASSN